MILIMRRKLHLGIAFSLVILTVLAFVYYISHHHNLITKLANTSPTVIISLLLLYGVWFLSMCAVVWISLRICRKSLDIKEGIMLNGYSTLFNFFIPGQGGIALRGAYLKKVKNLSVRKFIFVTLIYYMFYAVISAVLLLINNRPWWQTLGALVVVILLSSSIIYLFRRKSESVAKGLKLTSTNVSILFLITLIQSFVQVAIYAVELHSTNSHISLGQAVTYTGAANFSLFVALTPGAIGIRESFLIFSRHLSHISIANIVSASLIDRAVFIVFLGILFVMTIGFHARYKAVIKEETISV
jgi:uncharacterized membrane protein YbhN (UPF0104 family)